VSALPVYLYHVYVGTMYKGPARGVNEEDAIFKFARETQTNAKIYNAKRATSIKDLKAPKK
jgi:hypothetical protein